MHSVTDSYLVNQTPASSALESTKLVRAVSYELTPHPLMGAVPFKVRNADHCLQVTSDGLFVNRKYGGKTLCHAYTDDQLNVTSTNCRDLVESLLDADLGLKTHDSAEDPEEESSGIEDIDD